MTDKLTIEQLREIALTAVASGYKMGLPDAYTSSPITDNRRDGLRTRS